MCYAYYEKRKREINEDIKLSNQESIKICGEKENYKYLEIFVTNGEERETKKAL